MLEKVIDCIEKGKSVCLSGPAGTGKSWIIDRLREKYEKEIIVTASTGLASMNIKGQTIHSFCGMGTKNHKDQIKQITSKLKWEKIWPYIAKYKIHVIDEISMISGEQLDLIDALYRQACLRDFWDNFSEDAELDENIQIKAEKIKNTPFGGKVMIFTGDFLQLPPIVDKNCYRKWSFEAESWEELNPEKILLTKIYRQDDEEFQNLLNQLRIGRCTGKVNRVLSSRMISPPEGKKLLRLGQVNKVVDKINEDELNLIDEKEFTIMGALSWHSSLISEKESEALRNKKRYLMKKLFDASIAPFELKLKKGCKVMILKNDEEGQFVNGSTGYLIKGTNLLDTGIPKYGFCLQHIEEFIEVWGLEQIQKCKERNESIIDETRINLYESDVENYVYEVDGSQQTDTLKNLLEKYAFTEKGNPIKNASLKQVLKIKLDNGRIVYLEKTDDYKLITGECFDSNGQNVEVDLSMAQFPVKLGYAVTTHKSQGMTLDNVEIDFEGCFENGQVYVANSRVKSLEGLYIKNFHPSMVKADIDAVNFYSNN